MQTFFFFTHFYSFFSKSSNILLEVTSIIRLSSKPSIQVAQTLSFCTRDFRFQTTGKTFCPVIIYENLCFCVVSSLPSFKKATRKPRKNRETLRNKMAERRKNVLRDCAFTVILSPPTTHERCVRSLTSHSISKADGL